MRTKNPRSLSQKEIAEARRYKGVIRVVANYTIEKYQYEHVSGQRYGLKAWNGKAIKPFLWNGFRSEAQREEAAAALVKTARDNEAAKQSKKVAIAAARSTVATPFPVGTVFSNSWGYDQTNVDFYEVTTTNGQTIIIRKLKQNASETGWMTGTCQPVRGDYYGEPITKRIQFWAHDGKVEPYISAEFGCMTVWYGKAERWSSYH